MAENELDAFLRGSEPAQSEASPVTVPEPEPAEVREPKGAVPPEAQPSAQVKAEPDADEDGEPPEPQAGERAVPLRVLEDERHRRQDWKAKAIEAETRRSELEKQLAAAQRAAEAPRPPQPQYQQPAQQEEIPSPAIDPAGYHAYIEQRRAHDAMMHRADIGEIMLRAKIGDDKVDQMLVEWHQATARDPSLTQRAGQQRDPYAFAYKELERIRLQTEIGDDPAAWREAEREKLRAEIAAAAGNGASPPRVSPAAGMQPSLAGARNVAPRSGPAFTGPLSLDDILAPVNGAGRQARH